MEIWKDWKKGEGGSLTWECWRERKKWGRYLREREREKRRDKTERMWERGNELFEEFEKSNGEMQKEERWEKIESLNIRWYGGRIKGEDIPTYLKKKE